MEPEPKGRAQLDRYEDLGGEGFRSELAEAKNGTSGRRRHVPRTRAGSAWTSVAVGVFVLLLIGLFVLQNGRAVRVRFLWLDGQLSLGLALLFSAVLGGTVVALLGAVRIAQLRRSIRRR